MTRRERAEANFLQGFNCAQSIVLAFADLTGMNEQQLLRLASPFGGGMGRLRQVCGAVSGSFMLLGLLYGYDTPETGAPKAELYARVQALAGEFEAQHGSYICGKILKRGPEAPQPEARTEAYYASRPCARLIGDAAELLEQYINEHPVCHTDQ